MFFRENTMTTKNKILLVLNILAVGLCTFFLIHTLFFEDSPNIKLITKAVPIILIYSFGVGRFLYSRIRRDSIMLSNQYLPFFTGAFQNDKKNANNCILWAAFSTKAGTRMLTIKSNC